MAGSNDLVPGIWNTGDGSAPGHETSEIVVSQGAYSDGPEDPSSTAMRSAKNGDVAALPYPEATYWNSGRIGSRGHATATTQPTVLFDGLGFAITTADGSFISV